METMTADLARPLQLLLLSLIATLLSLPAFAETLIIVPADENSSTTMSRDIAASVVIPIMKAANTRSFRIKLPSSRPGRGERTALSGAASNEHAAKLGATKGVEVKVLRRARVHYKVVDLKAKKSSSKNQ